MNHPRFVRRAGGAGALVRLGDAGPAAGSRGRGSSGIQSGCRGGIAGVSRGDGLTGANAHGSRQRGSGGIQSGFRGRFVGVSRGDGLTGVGVSTSRQRGFSLIEIILVVVLIGGIVAFAATRILGGGDRARVNLARAQVQTLAEKVENFRMDTGRLPNALGDLVVQPGDAPGWLGPYARDSELNDPWGTPFEYRVPGEGRPFDVISYGADREPGGDSVNADIRVE